MGRLRVCRRGRWCLRGNCSCRCTIGRFQLPVAPGRLRGGGGGGKGGFGRAAAARFAGAVAAAQRLLCGLGACRRQGVRQAKNRPQGLFFVRAHCIGLVAPSRNSLRGPWPLRSNSRDDSVFDARFARGHKPCAPQRPRGAPCRSPPEPAFAQTVVAHVPNGRAIFGSPVLKRHS